MSKLKAVVAVAFVWSAAAIPAQRNRRGADIPPPDLKCGSYKDSEFDSAAMRRKIPYGVYLPKSYHAPEHEGRRYPLVVWLHGMWEDHMRFHERGGSQALDDLIGKGEVPELILVCPSPGRSSFYINGKNSGDAEDMVVKDLLAHIAATYRVESDRGRRALMGVSMGGMGALKIAFKHPGLFATVATHSAAIFPPDLDKLSDRFKNAMKSQWLAPMLEETFGDPIDKELWAANNPLALIAATDKEQLVTLQIYLDAGTKDRYGFDATNELLAAALSAKGLAHTWRKIEGGGHSWGEGLAKSSLPDSLRFVAKEFAKAAGQSALRDALLPGGSNGKAPAAGK
jgi:S-formylglutathione hydrolase